MKKSINLKSGFTLLEILLVVGIIAILAGIVILAINPTKQLGDARNAQRRSDVLTILNAVYQYSIDNNSLPSTIVTTGDCNTGVRADREIYGGSISTSSNPADLVDLYTPLVASAASTTYLVTVPRDPLATSTEDGSGYNIVKTTSGRVTVCAPLTEGDIDEISVTR